MTAGFIDTATWKRREHFELFRRVSQPFFSVTVELDATPLREACHHPDGPPFFLAALYCALQAANATEAFRLRIRGDRVWRHDRVHVTSTVLRNDDTFAFARFECATTLTEFVTAGRAELNRAKVIAPLTLPQGEDDLIYHSTVPWLRFTAFTNAIDVGTNSIPRVVFGKCLRDGAAWRMPVSVEVHHAVVDGLDVARFLERLESGFAELIS